MIHLWPIFGIFTQLTLGWLLPRSQHGRGRIISRPWHKLPLFRDVQPPSIFRFTQLCVLITIYMSLLIPVSVWTLQHFVTPIYWLSIAALYIDDWLTGDDDKWKKFWAGAKNKLKWKMKLPQPASAQTGMG